MQIEELAGFVHWFQAEIKSPNLIGRYTQLQQLLEQNAQGGQPAQPIEKQRTALLDAVRQVKVDSINQTQQEFARKIGLSGLVGEEAVKAINDILIRNALDVVTAAQKINEMKSQLEPIIKKMDQLQAGLLDYVQPSSPSFDEALLHLKFTDKASIENLSDLKKWSDDWYDIGRSVAMLHRLAPEDVKVLGASKGSLIYDLGIAYSVALTLSKIICHALKVAERVHEVRLAAERVRGLKLQNDKAALELDKQAEEIAKQGKDEALPEIVSGMEIDGEQRTALKMGIDKIFQFIDKGGEVDIYVPEGEEKANSPAGDEEQVKRITAIREKTKQISQLRRSIALLEDQSASE